MHAVDLHVHSTKSDGTLTPAGLVKHAKELGLSAFALTDHDTTGGLEEAVHAAQGTGVEVIPGIEFSTEYKGGDIHVLGYYFDYGTAEFQNRIYEFADARDLRNRKMCDRLCADGLMVPYEDLMAENPGAIVTRAHFAAYMLKHGIVKSTFEAFERYIGDNCKYFVPRKKITPQMAVKFILDFHGCAVLAHPLQYHLGNQALESLVSDLKDSGMTGLECIYSKYSPSDVSGLEHLARKNGLLVTGGSDYHGANKPGLEMGTGYNGRLFIPETVLLDLKHHLFHSNNDTKVFFSDLDGTLLNDTKKISQNTKDVLVDWARAGNRLVLNSGRAVYDIKMVVNDIGLTYLPGLYLCGFNGAELFDYNSQQTIFHEGISFETVSRIFDICAEENVYVHTYSDTGIVTVKASPETDFYRRYHKMEVTEAEDVTTVLKREPCKCIAISIDDPDSLERLRIRINRELQGRVAAFYSSRYYLEIVSVYASKGLAVQRLCRMLGTPISNSIAAGDAENDISMIRDAGLGVAMCNGVAGTPALSAAADIITKTDNNHDGLVPVLRRFL